MTSKVHAKGLKPNGDNHRSQDIVIGNDALFGEASDKVSLFHHPFKLCMSLMHNFSRDEEGYSLLSM